VLHKWLRSWHVAQRLSFGTDFQGGFVGRDAAEPLKLPTFACATFLTNGLVKVGDTVYELPLASPSVQLSVPPRLMQKQVVLNYCDLIELRLSGIDPTSSNIDSEGITVKSADTPWTANDFTTVKFKASTTSTSSKPATYT
jgi:hypothetical protein